MTFLVNLMFRRVDNIRGAYIRDSKYSSGLIYGGCINGILRYIGFFNLWNNGEGMPYVLFKIIRFTFRKT